jgi:hypothetical protein
MRLRLLTWPAAALSAALVAAGERPAPSSTAAAESPAFRLPCRAVAFDEVAGASGLDFRHDRGASPARHLPETMGSGVAWLDFDGDGFWDLYAIQSGPFPPDGRPRPPDRLFRNRGDGRFEEVTARAGTGGQGYGQGVVAADADGDGDPDLYLTNFGGDRLLSNQGDGSFADRTAAAGFGAPGWSSSAAFADADADGDLDLYVARYIDYDPGEDLFCGDPATGERTYCDPTLFAGARHHYYENRGGGSFGERGAEAGLGLARARGLGVLFTDLDGDRRPDLYVANDLDPNFLFHNLGDGRFEDLSLLSGAAVNRAGKPEAGMGLAVGDVDADGDPDLAVTNFDVETNTLYENLGDLMFEDVSAASGFGPPSFNLLGFGLVFADLDLDGDLDAYAANGHIFEQPRRDNVTYAQPDLLLVGDGRGHFAAEACGVLAGGPAVARGLARADFDHDGDVDLAISHSDGPLALLRNETAGRAWLGVRLEGTEANREAVGAKLTLLAAAEGAGEPTRQVRWVVAGDSYQSSSDRRQLFGWRDGERPLALEVEWPAGERRRLLAPPAGLYLVLPP